ncbi:hypothetical protein RhiirC2_796769 [Rhizophagus irregularis]|uniref:Uncharacterized protein n=1 Tax=Rhizophagus irregularis TaxID=588596 RepID=A0A2N1M954_9GLOM|nr:hypothetical protein RhiirC2_796769 [Rhizophagus irregularis]
MLIYYYGVVACKADWPDTYNVNRYVQNSKFNESKDVHELLIAPSCEKEAVKVLADMFKRWARFKKQLGDDEINELLAAEINAMVVKDSEKYYLLGTLEFKMKSDYRSRLTIVTSKTRDTHKEKLQKEWNIGQLARERFGIDKGYNIRFTTHNGSVIVASDWDSPRETKNGDYT